MAHKIKIRARHKNAALAARHATKLRFELHANITIQRRDKRGKFNKRGTQYTFIATPHRREMWRIIVAYPYLLNKKGSHKKGSPDQQTLRAIYYDKTREAVVKEKSRLRRKLYNRLKKMDRAWTETRTSSGLYRRVNVAVSKVEYKLELIGTTTFMDD